MAEQVRRKPPLPVASAFIACTEIYQDQRTGSTILIGPTSHFSIVQFPLTFVSPYGHNSPVVMESTNPNSVYWMIQMRLFGVGILPNP